MKNIHGGNLKELAGQANLRESDICDFSANINPLGPPEWLRPVISRTIDDIVNYPDPQCSNLVKVIAEKHQISSKNIVVGNGSSEIIQILPSVLGVKKAVIPVPSYLEYGLSCESAGLDIEKVYLDDNLGMDWKKLEGEIQGGELVFVANPNNPTGITVNTDKLRELANKYKDTVFVVDEAFIEFVEGGQSLIYDRPENVIVLRSMTKFYAIPGIRLGFAVGPKDIVEKIKKALSPWSVNSFAQAIGQRALKDINYQKQTIEVVSENRDRLVKKLSKINSLFIYPGKANFLLVRVGKAGFRASEFAAKLLKKYGIAVRVCDNYDGLGENYFRIAVKSRNENNKLCHAVSGELGGNIKLRKNRKTPAIMFQGCGSSAGKSFLATALCRVLLQDGIKVAPFKAQNMSLNSFVTRDGSEMGRAQVVQAQACKLDPDVRMNPILLKPNSDTGSQAIIMGKPVGNMNVVEYMKYKSIAVKAVEQAYDSLSSDYDAIVIEGAGSPAEINIKHNDIVNMRMAGYADAPVLLVGDIDRGGVFASFVGTMELLSQTERNLIAGFVVNKFRGDQSLLAPALDYTFKHTGKKVFGVIHYIKNAAIPEEDSVEFKSDGFKEKPSSSKVIDVAVIDLPHISNFTDFDPLGIEPDVNLRKVSRPEEIGSPDAIIIGGSKNVVADLAQLKKEGMAKAIKALAATKQTEIVGICGGFQILGKSIKDPHRMESTEGVAEGLGILPVTTVLAMEKTLKQATATHIYSGLEVRGYEIHHGQTELGGAVPAIRNDDGSIIGVQIQDGAVWATYLHGIFDCDRFRRWFIDRLRQKKGMQPLGKVVAVYDLAPAFDHLADVFRQSIDVNKIYELMGL